jgi:hypothetical protein
MPKMQKTAGMGQGSMKGFITQASFKYDETYTIKPHFEITIKGSCTYEEYQRITEYFNIRKSVHLKDGFPVIYVKEE